MGRSIYTIIKERKNTNIYIRNLSVISFCSALVSIMLTQMSLIMANNPNADQKYNLYFALGISVFTIIIGIAVLIKNLFFRKAVITEGK